MPNSSVRMRVKDGLCGPSHFGIGAVFHNEPNFGGQVWSRKSPLRAVYLRLAPGSPPETRRISGGEHPPDKGLDPRLSNSLPTRVLLG